MFPIQSGQSKSVREKSWIPENPDSTAVELSIQYTTEFSCCGGTGLLLYPGI